MKASQTGTNGHHADLLRPAKAPATLSLIHILYFFASAFRCWPSSSSDHWQLIMNTQMCIRDRGVPARVIKQVSAAQVEANLHNAAHYVEHGKLHACLLYTSRCV